LILRPLGKGSSPIGLFGSPASIHGLVTSCLNSSSSTSKSIRAI